MTRCALIVDDEPAIVRGLSLRLAASQWQTRVAYDGIRGLQLAREHQPDLIILDVRMPGMDGLEALAEIRNSPRTADIPVVMMSGSDNDRQAAFAAGASAFLPKPHQTQDLLQIISDLSPAAAHVTA